MKDLALRLRFSPQSRQPNNPKRPERVSYYEQMAFDLAGVCEQTPCSPQQQQDRNHAFSAVAKPARTMLTNSSTVNPALAVGLEERMGLRARTVTPHQVTGSQQATTAGHILTAK